MPSVDSEGGLLLDRICRGPLCESHDAALGDDGTSHHGRIRAEYAS